jgi:hypothetical protein
MMVSCGGMNGLSIARRENHCDELCRNCDVRVSGFDTNKHKLANRKNAGWLVVRLC